MRPGRWVLLGVVGWLLHLALLAGLCHALPVALRVLLAFVALVLTPGLAFVAAGLRPPGRGWFDVGWALGFGVAWCSLLLVVTILLGRPFTLWSGGAAITTPLLWAALWPAIRRARRAAETAEGARGWSRLTLAVLVAALALGAMHSARYGAPLNYVTDSPDHVGTIRRMLEHGDPFPADAFFKDAGVTGEDPRKGLWHPQVALIARLADADPLDTWRWLPIALVPLFTLNVASLGWLLRGRRGAAVAAWALVLTYGGSMIEQYLREAVLATKLGDQLAVATAVAVLLDFERRSRSSRLAVILLGFAAVAVHVWYAIAFALAFGALALALLVVERGAGPRTRRLIASTMAMGAICAPWLAWRALVNDAPSNPIHLVTQGVLTVVGHVEVMNIGMLWDWLGLWWVLIPLAAVALWREGRERTATLYLVTTPAVVAAVLFVPPLVALLRPRLGYLLLRTVWMVPLAAFLAWLLVALWDRMRHGTGRARVTSALALAGVVLLSMPALHEAFDAVFDARHLIADERDRGYARWGEALRWMDRGLPAASVVLADPITAYTIPMATRHYVTELLDQHSSPNDAHAIDRIIDARDALDPYGSWGTLRAVVGRYGVDAIALNDRFVESPPVLFWSSRHEGYGAMRARFDRHPAAFQRVFDQGDFVVYRVHHAALDTVDSPVPARPYVRAFDPAHDGVARRMGEGLPALQRLALARRVLAPGDTLHGVLAWRMTEPLPRGSYLVSVRFDTPMPGGFHPPRWVAKPARKLLERARHEVYRFRGDHLPVDGDYGVDLWRPDEVVSDSFAVTVPGNVADGVYTVRVRMIAQAPYPNYRLSDYFFDDDYYAGLVASNVIVTRTPHAVPERLLREAAGFGGH